MIINTIIIEKDISSLILPLFLFLFIISIFIFNVIKNEISIIGISEEDLRNLLLNSLDNLKLKYTETINKIKLDELDAEINISYQSFMESSIIRMKKKNNILKNIIQDVRRNINESEFNPNKKALFIHLIFLITSLLLGVLLLYLPSGQSSCGV